MNVAKTVIYREKEISCSFNTRNDCDSWHTSPWYLQMCKRFGTSFRLKRAQLRLHVKVLAGHYLWRHAPLVANALPDLLAPTEIFDARFAGVPLRNDCFREQLRPPKLRPAEQRSLHVCAPGTPPSKFSKLKGSSKEYKHIYPPTWTLAACRSAAVHPKHDGTLLSAAVARLERRADSGLVHLMRAVLLETWQSNMRMNLAKSDEVAAAGAATAAAAAATAPAVLMQDCRAVPSS